MNSKYKQALFGLLPSKYQSKLIVLDKRSKTALLNSTVSIFAKLLSVVCSLAIVPLTINYVNPTRYGIWLTLSGIIAWISFFDLGFGNGFRNRFAEAKANGNTLLARQYLSTTYFAVSCIVFVVFIALVIINHFLSWSNFLNVDIRFNEELSKVFIIVSAIFCTNMIANIFITLLSADQRNGMGAIINGVSQFFSLICIYTLTRFTSGSLIYLALVYAGVPCVLLLIISLFCYAFTDYHKYRPSITCVKPVLIRPIMSLGVQFFIINLCLIMVFQIVNIVISREIGADSVSVYNVSNKYFNTIYMLIVIIITPLWSAFTEAKVQNDYKWMKEVVKQLDRMINIVLGAYFIMLVISPFVYNIWIGNSLDIPFVVSISVMLLSFCQSFVTTYMYLINGIGTIRMQLYLYVCFAILCWPLMTICGRIWGLVGIIAIPTVVYLLQGIIAKIQLSKIINQTATGVWVK